MKAAWEAYPDSGGFWPDWPKLERHDVGRLYVMTRKIDMTKPNFVAPNIRQVNPEYRVGVNSHHVVYGLAYDPHWDLLHEPQLVVDAANADLIAAGADRAVCPFMFDIETHDAHFVAEVLRLWRKIRPTRLTSWTLEPNQGGWFTTELVDRINRDPNLVVLPQNFYGDMTPFDAPAGAKLRANLIATGIQSWRVKVFYDGALRLPTGWDGCVLSEERLTGAKVGARAGTLSMQLRRLRLATSA